MCKSQEMNSQDMIFMHDDQLDAMECDSEVESVEHTPDTSNMNARNMVLHVLVVVQLSISIYLLTSASNPTPVLQSQWSHLSNADKDTLICELNCPTISNHDSNYYDKEFSSLSRSWFCFQVLLRVIFSLPHEIQGVFGYPCADRRDNRVDRGNL